ncbi:MULTISPECIES: GTP-binding protein [Clostridium]|uniref:GTP-binding protein n=1 Tax=Clostridium TaxID=1485 RepID=UPI000983D52A|nr:MULTISPECIES: GTP-binding protein [Clostridium]AQR95817.1 putative GTP-binding protein YjiA [Clostridium saccharoperbutylacetonicum]NSB31680.1 G3E family GTPase [Clostridium saccharoperbutylacetonicum]
MKAKIDIFSGFLGAGKTLLIKKLLSEKAYGNNTVIIENEFGEVGIDGQILRECKIDVKEINSGCICCQVSGNFGDAIIEVINGYNPDKVIIEPSGVAKLSEILNLLNGSRFQSILEIRNIFTLIDVRNYKMYLKNFKEFYENQIKKANKIVLSRSQMLDRKAIDEIISSLKTINSGAEIIYDSWDNLKAKDFLKNNTLQSEIKSNNSTKFLIRQINHSAKEIFENFPIYINKNVNIEEIEKKFEVISNNDIYGNIIRAKGVVEDCKGIFHQFDYVPNEFKSRNIKWSNVKVLSIIGSHLNRTELEQLFSK